MDNGWVFVYRRRHDDVDEYMSDSKPEVPPARFEIDFLQVAKIFFQILLFLKMLFLKME